MNNRLLFNFMIVITPIVVIFLALFEADAQDIAEDNSPKMHQTPDALGRHVFEAIRNNKYTQAKNTSPLIFTPTDMKQIGRDLIKSVEQKINKGDYDKPADGHAIIQGIRLTFLNDDEIKKQFLKVKKEEKNFRKSFEKIQGMAQKHGFQWKRTEYLRTDDSQIMKDKSFTGMPIGNLFIHFMAGDRKFSIKLPHCAKPPKLGWLIDSDPLSLEPVNKTK